MPKSFLSDVLHKTKASRQDRTIFQFLLTSVLRIGVVVFQIKVAF